MSSRSGGLLELVARGKKDVFFTANPTISFFHSVYKRAAPFTKEIHLIKPRNTPEWGKWVDFDFDHRGDIVKNTYIRIELPSWLPETAKQANASGIVTYDLSGTTYGYCNNIGFQMLEKIQFFQDQVLLHETYGEFLDWRLRQLYDQAKIFIVGSQIGSRDESALAIGRSASLQELRVPISILGWQSLADPGLPMIALRRQRFRIRIFLRKLEEIVVASDGRIPANPWNKQLYIQSTKNGKIDTTQKSLVKSAMKTIGMTLETTQLYIPADAQIFLKAQTIRFPFQNIQSQQYTIDDNVFTAASLNPLGVVKFPMVIDCIGSINRFLVGFRSEAATMAGQRLDLRSPVTQDRFINTMRLNISNIDRVKQWSTAFYKEVTSYWKNDRMALELYNLNLPQEVYTITFGGSEKRVPSGTINFTRAVNAILYLTLNAIEYDPRIISRKTFALLYAESWNVIEITDGKGKLMFDDS